jgi:hypothetical protein
MYSSSKLLFKLMVINIINLFSPWASDFSYGIFFAIFFENFQYIKKDFNLINVPNLLGFYNK